MKNEEIQKRMQVMGKTYEPMDITIFRKDWLKKGYDLVDVTNLCEFKLGQSGWCNDFNEPDEPIYHIKVIYRNECIGTLYPSENQDNFEEEYVVFIFEGEHFIIFRKVKLENENAKKEKRR